MSTLRAPGTRATPNIDLKPGSKRSEAEIELIWALFLVCVLVFRSTLGGARGVRSKKALVILKINVLTSFSAMQHKQRTSELLGKSEAFKKVYIMEAPK